MKKLIVLFISLIISSSIYSQLMVSKMLGKNAGKSKLGYGVFAYYDFPLSGSENKYFCIEFFDFAFFQSKSDTVTVPIGYISIKLGYKYIFSETKTGFYIEPQAGYCRVVSNDPDNITNQSTYGDGVALALEIGYSLEVGQRGHTFNFGLKYEDDIAGSPNTMSSIGFRVSYTFNLLKRKDGY
jgi:hypothetical protein